MYRRWGPSWIGIIYLIVGVVVAVDRNYFRGINNVEEVVEANPCGDPVAACPTRHRHALLIVSPAPSAAP